jgi:putative superfamily III holin-X
MPTHVTERRGVGPAAKEVAEHASTLARLELELAALEVKRKVAALGVGMGLVAGAGIFLLFGLGFGLATAAAALALVFSTWLALLIVFGGLVLFAGLLALLGVRMLGRGVPPVPEQAMAEARLITEALKRNGSHE